MLFDLVLNTIC